MDDHGVGFGRIAATLGVTDMARAYSFYADILGFEKTFENGNPVQFMILKRGQAELHLILHPEHQAAGFNVAHMLVDDAAALHTRCQDAEVHVIKFLQDKDYGLRSFVIADPDGNRIDIGQALVQEA